MRTVLWLMLLFLISGSAPVVADDDFYVIPVDRTPVKDFYTPPCYFVPWTLADGAHYSTNIIVPEFAGKVKKVEVVLFIAHSNNEDLDVTLSHGGKTVVLFTDIGGSGEGIFVHLDDDAERDIGSVGSVAIDGGRWRPEGTASLADFNGLDAGGDWVITIDDDTLNGKTGKLHMWALYIVD